MSLLVSMVLKLMVKGGKKVHKNLELFSSDPETIQTELLKKLITTSSDSEIGKEYDFSSIQTIQDFQERIPLTDYTFYNDKIERMMNGEKNILTSQDIVHINVTSGTLGAPKKLPITQENITKFATYNAKYLNYVASKQVGTKWTKGKCFSLSEGSCEVLPSGITMGSASSVHTAKKDGDVRKSDPMNQVSTSPNEARHPSAPGEYTRYLHARFALAEKNVTYGNATFSSLYLELFRYIDSHWEMLCNDIEKGTIDEHVDIPEKDRESVCQTLTPQPERANELRKIFTEHSNKAYARLIWPNFQFIICVAGANFQQYTDKLIEKYLGNEIHILYLGLTSSEGYFSVPMELDNPNSLLVPDGSFMEFIPVIEDECDYSQKPKLMWELEVGKRYELLITNLSGLFRYQLKDVIEVTGFYNKTPMIQFISRSGFAINMYSEKTSELALSYAANSTTDELGLTLLDYCVCPYWDDNGGRYIFMYEIAEDPDCISQQQLREITEKHLMDANPSYKNKVQVHTCQPLEVKLLQRNTFSEYTQQFATNNRSAAQMKPIHVIKNSSQQAFFFSHTLS